MYLKRIGRGTVEPSNCPNKSSSILLLGNPRFLDRDLTYRLNENFRGLPIRLDLGRNGTETLGDYRI